MKGLASLSVCIHVSSVLKYVCVPPVCLKDLLFQQGRNQSYAFAMQESQRKEIPELHSGNQAVKDLPLKMELYVSHFHGLFTLAQLLWHKKKEAFSFTHTNNQANCPYLKMVEHVYLSSLPSESLPCTRAILY